VSDVCEVMFAAVAGHTLQPPLEVGEYTGSGGGGSWEAAVVEFRIVFSFVLRAGVSPIDSRKRPPEADRTASLPLELGACRRGPCRRGPGRLEAGAGRAGGAGRGRDAKWAVRALVTTECWRKRLEEARGGGGDGEGAGDGVRIGAGQQR
jgi:hypothetical protein